MFWSHHMWRRLLKMDWARLWARLDRILDHIEWAWNAIMLFLFAVLVVPLVSVAIFMLLTDGPAPAPPIRSRETLNDIVFGLACILPIWLAIAGYARFASTPLANSIQNWIDWAFWKVIWTGTALMVVFAVLRWFPLRA